MVDGPVLGDFKELVSRSAGPTPHVRVARGIVRQHLENLPNGHFPEGFPCPEDRDGAKQPEAVQGPIDGQGSDGARAVHATSRY